MRVFYRPANGDLDNNPPPASRFVGFGWNFLGDVSQVSAPQGTAEAHLGLRPSATSYSRYKKTVNNGQVTTNEPVPANPQNTRLVPPAYHASQLFWDDVAQAWFFEYVIDSMATTHANAEAVAHFGPGPSASATSAAATISVVPNSITATDP